jgi:transposase
MTLCRTSCAIVEPLLPAPPRPPYGGRHRTISDRACLAAIVYMARTSTPWRLLPARELDCGSPATCWRAYRRRRGIKARMARRRIESSAGLGRHRWKVERALLWLSYWRLQGRWDRDAGRWFAFVLVACAVVCLNRL